MDSFTLMRIRTGVACSGLKRSQGQSRAGLLRWTPRAEFDHTWPDVLPNGKGVLFTIRFSAKNGAKGRTSYAIAVADIPSGEHRVIVDDAMYARYATSGHLL